MVARSFKSEHLLRTNRTEASSETDDVEAAADKDDDDDEVDEITPVRRFCPEPDAIESLVEGESEALLIVPKLREGDHLTGRNSTDLDLEDSTNATVGDSSPQQKIPKEITAVTLRDAAARAALSRNTTVILPGSYNPLHRGHLRLLQEAQALQAETSRGSRKGDGKSDGAGEESPEDVVEETVEEVLGGTAMVGARGWGVATNPDKAAVHAVFEVSIVNADKGGLSVEEVRRRALQFTDPASVAWPVPVVLTRAPLFSQKVGTGNSDGEGYML